MNVFSLSVFIDCKGLVFFLKACIVLNMIKILIISDGHGAVEKLSGLTKIAAQCDAVIFAGDFAAFQKPETGLPFLKELVKLHKHIFAVLGNCDPPEFEAELKKSGISVSASLKKFGELYFAGSGGGSKFTGTTPYERSDEELVSDLAPAAAEAEKAGGVLKNLILVCHNPPHGTKTDKVAPLVHVGSKGITQFIETYQPVLAVSGHIHESFAVDKIGNTVLVNPGALMEGRYAVAEVSCGNGNTEVHIDLKTL